ncbi:MAG: tRNA uridine-5-carboxymethylaminomethyl(34) synthesis GTPase MnmE [Alphaproteobacteria bacterium]|nr:tRNA uridine-5-carboxymethylaminomethyl(34) synthesis GTPase MnmE [Alphaproteobacteria bacterium]
MNNDTIFALSSGHGKSGVAVIRVSGENLRGVFTKFINKSEYKNRFAYFTNLRDDNGELIDQCLAIYFPAPHSFTGQDVIELHTHGAPAVINAVFEFLSSLGMRMAMPGEFSRRAFYNNKMDLADVDGLAALLDAQTDVQRKHALQSMLGRDSEIYNMWRTQMVEISAYAAAMLDYSPDDLPANIGETILSRTQKLYDEIGVALRGYRRARAIRGGINVALVGETNVGKSSVFNYLVGSNRAIVSDIAGTTRDVVSATIDIDGYMVNLSDTAGIRETDDIIESIGIERTKNEIENADLVVRVFTPEQQSAKCNLTTSRLRGAAVQSANNEIIIINKSDMLSEIELCTLNSELCLCVSAHTGDGMDKLMDTLRKKIHEMFDGRESDLSLNARTKALLESAYTELESAIGAGGNYDIFAEHTRRAADNIGKILGTITANEILDMTFGQLCLGK